MQAKILLCLVLGVIGSLGADALSAQTPPAAGYSVTQLGLHGSDYQSDTALYSSYANAFYAPDKVIGYNQRRNSAGAALGQDAWFYDGTSTHRIGFIGAGYEYAYSGTGGGTFRSSSVYAGRQGKIVGGSLRRSATGADLGRDLWQYSAGAMQLIGFTGDGYEFDGPNGPVRSSTFGQLNSSGRVIGKNAIYNASGSVVGSDAWLFDGTNTTRLGLSGSGYEGPCTGTGGGSWRSSTASFINDSGQIAGSSFRVGTAGSVLGEDAWVRTGDNTQIIGLTGAPYEAVTADGVYRRSIIAALNAAGHAVGLASRPTPTAELIIGEDAWLYDGSTTQLINLTGGAYEYTYSPGNIARRAASLRLSTAGQASGLSMRYNPAGFDLGQDAWLHTDTGTQLIGLTGTDYQYNRTGIGAGIYRRCDTRQMNDAGQVVGRTSRYSSSGVLLGYDAWLSDESTTRIISLTGNGYDRNTSDGIYRASEVTYLNSVGQAIGHTFRSTPEFGVQGATGWFYDGATDTTTPLAFSFRSSDNFSDTRPTLVTDDGVVLGSYFLYSGTTFLGSRAFWWSTESGFYDLGGLVNGGLSSDQWQYLWAVTLANGPDGFSNVAGGSPWYVLGSGTTSDGGQSTYLLTAVVPEPAGIAILLFLTGGLLSRRFRP